MRDTAIKVDGLGKRYRIGEHAAGGYRYKSLREGLAGVFRRKPTTGRRPLSSDHIWAVRNVSFEIKRGEVVGIIGRNGAGKSTLLKILSQITEPTTGTVDIHGRVGSLLEVGTGFHPELTGRENIFLNGAILGMKRNEIRDKFDEIVAFAEVEKFIDTPVKHYSSGMAVRLAFAVAAHLEPEILLVDEVLAVGDISFQKKCLGKMDDVAQTGRVVLLVSHNLAAIRALCSRVIGFNEGVITGDGPANEVIELYQNMSGAIDEETEADVRRAKDETGPTTFFVRRVRLRDADGNPTTTLSHNGRLVLVIDLAGDLPGRTFNLEYRIHNQQDQLVAVGSSAFNGLLYDKTTRCVTAELGPMNLTKGFYRISLSLVDSQSPVRYDNWNNCCSFEIIRCDPFGFGHELKTGPEGICVIPQQFNIPGGSRAIRDLND